MATLTTRLERAERAVGRRRAAAERLSQLPPDPVLLARAAGIAPDPWQVRLLQSTAPRILLNCSRQSGKSTTTAVLATHTALYRPRSLILLLSRAERQSEELFRKCMDVYRALGKPVHAESERVLGLELGNGSRIIALPGKEDTVRSFSGVALLAVDEASRVPDQLYYSIRPMLAVSGGRLVVLSTPFGKRGFFHKEWTEGEGWERFEVPATMCPRISPEFLAEERRALPPWWYQQEYECRFGETADQLFSYEDIQASVSAEVAPLFAN
jgi:hypothetical protein